ncbi:DUF2924 domain-containing protein [Sphingomonas sabuli]|uniref:DUF2924 domain-containing protein n=1 Tax=Sphingomonas sabuli TaxID=2764186 RepID=UPI001CA4653E|nr:DUF2924 domain-containing protein [Sphingomonas sabuli]
MKKADRITAEVRALEALDLHGLRDEWRRRYGEPPKMRSTELLARLLAWKIQADAFGGLDAATIRLLNAETLPPPTPVLEPGTRLSREWQGRRHEVDVLESGFRYDDHDYRSLSQVAREITGTRWNGLRFFGLREQPK